MRENGPCSCNKADGAGMAIDITLALQVIGADTTLSDDEKSEIARELQARVDEEARKDYFNTQCRHRRLRGAVITVQEQEILGRLDHKDRFCRRLLVALRGIGYRWDLRGIERFFDFFFGDGDFLEDAEIEHFFSQICGDLPVTAASVTTPKDAQITVVSWLFRNPDRPTDSVLNGLCAGDLPHRLGLLNVRAGDRYLCFEIPGTAANNSRMPTIFDCDWSQLEVFRPGGLTLPTGNHPQYQGLEEMVAIAPKFKFINGFPVGVVANGELGV